MRVEQSLQKPVGASSCVIEPMNGNRTDRIGVELGLVD